MASVMIGIDPHKASHTAVAIGGSEEPLGELRVRASGAQADRLLEWAAAWPQRTWAVCQRSLGNGSGSLFVRAGAHVAGVACGVLITAFAIMAGVRL